MSFPRLPGPPLALPSAPGLASEIWTTLAELAAAEPDSWTLIGGQMVLLHALEHKSEPTRFSTDLDILVNARVVAGAVGAFVDLIEARGFTPAGGSPDGVTHRYARGQTVIDVLAPEGLGPRADLTTTPPGRTIQVPGGTQALARTELLPVECSGSHGHIPRPSLLGAIICKAAAIPVHRYRQVQLGDLALLLSLIADPQALVPDLSHKDRVRLRAVSEVASPEHAVWADFAVPAAAQARLALRTLLPGAPPAGAPAADTLVERSLSLAEGPDPSGLDI
ncbi:MAG: hypothetical protein F4236_05675 [Acidimicrobiia bacterium]|nr:hypothetical protein [Acidimicrobiia bacterium]MYE67639.1 hypothetical protein [Acidimicrobiia bacterium]MYJ13130.1 hypothetical protein [Acidimicrobiia bacterium]